MPSVSAKNGVHFQNLSQFSEIHVTENKMTEVIALRREAQDWNVFLFKK